MPERGFYYHYKHNPDGAVNNYAYEVMGVGCHTEDNCRPEDINLVVYRPLYESSVYKAASSLTSAHSRCSWKTSRKMDRLSLASVKSATLLLSSSSWRFKNRCIANTAQKQNQSPDSHRGSFFIFSSAALVYRFAHRGSTIFDTFLAKGDKGAEFGYIWVRPLLGQSDNSSFAYGCAFTHPLVFGPKYP